MPTRTAATAHSWACSLAALRRDICNLRRATAQDWTLPSPDLYASWVRNSFEYASGYLAALDAAGVSTVRDHELLARLEVRLTRALTRKALR